MGAFDKITGQKRAITLLQRSILADRISHAWLFCGPSAADLNALALAFATTIQCTGRTPDQADACMLCKSCRQAMDGNHPDIRVWPHEKPKTFKVDEVRDLVSDAFIRPYESERKVYIVPDAHLMNAAAQNALLKTLEEPPEYVVIILLSNSADAMLETILSRCQTIELAAGAPDIDSALRSTADNILTNIQQWNLEQIHITVKTLGQFKVQADLLLEMFAAWYRDVLYFKATLDADGILDSAHLSQIRNLAGSMSYDGLQAVISDIRKAGLRLKANVNYELTMELLLLSMKDHAS